MFIDVFEELCLNKGISATAGVVAIGLSKSNLAYWKEKKDVTNVQKKKIADFFGIQISELNQMIKRDSVTSVMSGLPTSSLVTKTWDDTFGKTNKQKKALKIPVLGRVSAGVPIDAIEDIVDYEEIVVDGPGDYFALQVQGDSMEPKISAGDVVIVRKQSDVDSGEIAVVIVNGSEATIKRIKKRPDGIVLLPSNPTYEPMYFTNEDVLEMPVSILGKVIELRAKFE